MHNPITILTKHVAAAFAFGGKAASFFRKDGNAKRTFAIVSTALALASQDAYSQDVLKYEFENYFMNYKQAGYAPTQAIRLDSIRVSDSLKVVYVFPNEAFCGQALTANLLKDVSGELARLLPDSMARYEIQMFDKRGRSLSECIPNARRKRQLDLERKWNNIDYHGMPWIENLSKPHHPKHGLKGRHLFISPSHGKYYKNATGYWSWQRPRLFCTTEDLFTQSIVLPYLIPMLENAGAIVATPRERDANHHRCVVDNDTATMQGIYSEIAPENAAWRDYFAAGFKNPGPVLNDTLNPFLNGTARIVATQPSATAQAQWTPHIPQRGRYAVYVSYQTLPQSVSDALYEVRHLGGTTRLHVNQQMGGGTWAYLGTYLFDEGFHSERGSVVLYNQSNQKGIVCADAAYFGGGMGMSLRNGLTSGLPRFLEGARYHAQWCGVPDTLFNQDRGTNDYNDDIRSRSHMLNYMSGGSIYQPGKAGLAIPFELSLAVHSDAGRRQRPNVVGTLGISTTIDHEQNTRYVSGISRMASYDLADELLSTIHHDLSRSGYPEWKRREVWDRNYGETRTPNVPAAILETLSHQNFDDMKYGHDPHFKFLLARSVYKALLRYVYRQHDLGTPVVQPLPVRQFQAMLSPDGREAELSWQPTDDKLEPSAEPTGYIVYTRIDNGDFDQGVLIGRHTHFSCPVAPGLRYDFRITAVNEGGESFPSEVLSVYKAPGGQHRLLIVNAFDRVSGPATLTSPDSVGFDIQRDYGVPYVSNSSLCGQQLNFSPLASDSEGPNAHGYSSSELEGKALAGNTFAHTATHAQAAATLAGVSISSCSREAFEHMERKQTEDFDIIDYLCGLQRDVPYNSRTFKTFPPATRNLLAHFADNGGHLLVSGAYIGSDMQQPDEQAFCAHTLGYRCQQTAVNDTLPNNDAITALGTTLHIQRTVSDSIYAVQHPDVLQPASKAAFTAFAYADGQPAGIALQDGKRRAICMGFPLEAIRTDYERSMAMRAILKFLLGQN